MLIDFYHRVSDQVVAVGQEIVPRLEGYESAVRLFGYPESMRSWYVAGAAMLHRLVCGQDQVNWWAECGKSYRDITAEDID